MCAWAHWAGGRSRKLRTRTGRADSGFWGSSEPSMCGERCRKIPYQSAVVGWKNNLGWVNQRWEVVEQTALYPSIFMIQNDLLASFIIMPWLVQTIFHNLPIILIPTNRTVWPWSQSMSLSFVRVLRAPSRRMNSELGSAVCPPGGTFWLMWLPSSCVSLCICAQMCPMESLEILLQVSEKSDICAAAEPPHTLKRIRCYQPRPLLIVTWSSFNFLLLGQE